MQVLPRIAAAWSRVRNWRPGDDGASHGSIDPDHAGALHDRPGVRAAGAGARVERRRVPPALAWSVLPLVTVSAPGDNGEGRDPIRADHGQETIDLGLAPRRVRVGLGMLLALGIWGLIVLACALLVRLFRDLLEPIIG